jgi:GNAT superfamily N-acetyltransferase
MTEVTRMNTRNAMTTESTLVFGVILAAYRPWASGNGGYVPDPSLSQIEQSISASGVLVIEMDDALVSCAQFHMCDGVAAVQRLAVHPIHQRHRLGSRLLAAIEARALTESCHAVELRAPTQSTAAISFLRCHGYQPVAEIGSLSLYRKELALPPPAATVSYQRIGACLRSGKCCSRIFLRYQERFVMQSDLEQMGEAGLRNLNDFTQHIGVHFSGELPDGTAYFQCDQVHFNSDGVASCGIYGQSGRPETCTLFPVSPSAYRYRSCGYCFIAVPDASSK